MRIVFFAHPAFLGHQSMPRFANWLNEEMAQRGHTVNIWKPEPFFYRLPLPSSFKKWLGYIDQYIVFPVIVRLKLLNELKDTLFVITDHALGPWVPLIAKRPHVIHCHDFLAQYSALGKIPENPTGWSGVQYQAFIRRGYKQGKYFVSVSEKTREDLHDLLKTKPVLSEVVYNGLTQVFSPSDHSIARDLLGQKYGLDVSKGFLLHVGGNQWYKNRVGVLKLYIAWRNQYAQQLPLLMIGQSPTDDMVEIRQAATWAKDIHFLTGVPDADVQLAYASASVFLFPSLAEGFGWPIAEAMASGCPVVTTALPPMTEVAGTAAFLLPIYPYDPIKADEWAVNGAKLINHILQLSAEDRKHKIEQGLKNAERFNSNNAIDKIEKIYKKVLNLK